MDAINGSDGSQSKGAQADGEVGNVESYGCIEVGWFSCLCESFAIIIVLGNSKVRSQAKRNIEFAV